MVQTPANTHHPTAREVVPVAGEAGAMATQVPIRKGFVLKARKIEDSEIAHAAPCTRELFDLIIRKANFADRPCGRTIIRRGQWLTSYEEIQDLLHWRVGFRKLTYTRHQINAAMKYLRSVLMIATRKATRGLFITALNYEKYQNQANYERHTESHNENHNKATRQRKNDKTYRIFDPKSDESRLSHLLFSLIREHDPKYREPDLQKWATHIDRLIRIDKRPVAEVEAVIRWSQADSFWHSNVLSTDKLRAKYPQLLLKMNEAQHGHRNPERRDFGNQSSDIGTTIHTD